MIRYWQEGREERTGLKPGGPVERMETENSEGRRWGNKEG